MPTVKETVQGREYSFAPLLFGEWEQLADEALSNPTATQRVRNWIPRIESSMKRAGCEMPDIRVMDLIEANAALDTMIRAILKASGMTPSGEASRAAA